MKSIKLSNGSEMPLVGLGTWRAQPKEIENAVQIALENGYRHIDTAFNYNTEESIGKTVTEWIQSGKGRREDLFITTKLPNFGNRPNDVEKFIKLSLSKLNLSYLDLYLIHMPFSFHCDKSVYAPLTNEDGTFSLDVDNDIIKTWKEMEKQVKSGLTKAIGLSNFNAEQVQRIYDSAEIKPAVLQIELHAYLQQKEMRETCKKLNIAVTAYSPLGSPGANTHFSNKYNYSLNDFPDILGHPTVKRLAEKYNKSPGQILLKHLVQQNIIVIPKSGNPERIKANIDLFTFDLSQEDLETLNSLDKNEEGRIFDFLFFKGVEKHPEYPFKRSKA
nr:alcohol dehydrogenase [NADP(+)]-like [Leptinotarsa decemlineata]